MSQNISTLYEQLNKMKNLIAQEQVNARRTFLEVAELWQDIKKDIVEIKMLQDASIEEQYIKMLLENGVSLKDAIKNLRQDLVIRLREDGTTVEVATALRVSRKTVERISKQSIGGKK